MSETGSDNMSTPDTPAAHETAPSETPGRERKPLSPEAREALKRQLKAELRAHVEVLKRQILGDRKKTGDKDVSMAAENEVMTEDKTRNGEKASAAPDTSAAAAPARDMLELSSTGKAAQPETSTAQTEDKHEEAPASALPKEELNRLTADIIAALKTIYDPEIPVDIFELGLIYRIDISDDRVITVDMTLTAPGCPVAGDMPGWVEKAVREVEGVADVRVNLVFDPPWDMSRMSDEARLALNMW